MPKAGVCHKSLSRPCPGEWGRSVNLHASYRIKLKGFAVVGIGLVASAFNHATAIASELSDRAFSDPLLATLQSPPVHPLQFEMTTGVDYSVGDYDQNSDTTVVSAPIIAKAYLGRLRLEGSLSYVTVKGPGQVVGGVIVTPSSNTTTTRRSGIGDVNLTAGYQLIEESPTYPSIEISTDIKLGTAKTTIGTGETDYGLSANLSKSVGSNLMVFGSLGYSWLGDPSDYDLKDGVIASLGLNYSPVLEQNYGLTASYREPVADGLDGQLMVSPYLTYRMADRWGLTLYGAGGLNSSSPRFGAGLRLSYFP